MGENIISRQSCSINNRDWLPLSAPRCRAGEAVMAASNALVSYASLRRLRPVACTPPLPSPPSASFRSSRILDRESRFAGVRVGRPLGWHVSQASSESTSSPSVRIGQDMDSVPTPVVLIDQDSDSNATIVEVSFGDRLGNLLDTMKALKDLGLDVVKGTVSTGPSVIQTKLFMTHFHTGRKVEDPDMLERIRLTILNNLLKYHPESSERLALGEAFGIKAPQKKIDVDVATHINIKDDGPKRSLLYIETADRPGLLMEIIKILSDINVNVESAEIDTEGLVAKDKFHVSYSGSALNSSISQVLINCLRYYLRRPETDEDSY